MPQMIHVVQCYGCHMYQVDIVKKSSKWTCKLCCEKQSLRTVIFQGSGKECRLQVQKLNEMKGNAEQKHLNAVVSAFSSGPSDELDPPEEIKKQSNWSEFVDDDIYDEFFNGPMEITGQEVSHNSQEDNKPPEFQHQQKCTVLSKRNGASCASNNVVVQTKPSPANCFSESHSEQARQFRKIETNNITHRSEWDQYLPDELSSD